MEFRSLDIRLDDTAVLDAIDQLYDPARDSFFISPAWMKTWLATLPPAVNVEFVTGYHNDQLRVAFFLGATRYAFCGLPLSYLLSLNATGNAYYDELTIEYNDFFGGRAYIGDVSEYLVNRARKRFVFKLDMPGVVREAAEALNLSGRGLELIVDEKTSYYINANRITNDELPVLDGYLNLLSKNRRAQLRRSLRLFAEQGGIQLRRVTDTDEAIALYEKMAALKTEDLQKKQRASCYANAYFNDFHHHLITHHMQEGIVLYEFTVGNTLVGVIYGFISQKRFLVYQGGFLRFEDNRMQSGQCCHVLLVEEMAKLGIKEYDFLAGNELYKNSLSTDQNVMCWLTLRKHSKFLDVMRKLKRQGQQYFLR